MDLLRHLWKVMPDRSITGFILAGGKSQRMGTDKATLPWKHSTLIEHMVARLRAVARPVRIVGRGDLPDRHPNRGPVEGIATALAATATENNLIVAMDLPFLDKAFLHYFANRLRAASTDLLACDVGEKVPLCLGIRSGLLPDIDGYLISGKRSLQGWVQTVKHTTISAEELHDQGFSSGVFRNLNTPEDYRLARGK